MKRIIWLILLISVFTSAQANREVAYIQKYALLAVQEMEKYKIPASITLAQGILETGGGQSRLAEQANNHFGIKCKKEWRGATIYHDDDAIGECFRKYNSVAESFRDHSKFLAERPYYKRLFQLDMMDYKGWAHGLKKAGYATNPRYAYILINKIENYNLQEFDAINRDQVYDKLVVLYGPVDRKIVDPNYKEPETMVAVAGNPKTKPTKETKVSLETPVASHTGIVPKEESDPKKMEVPVRRISKEERVKRHPIGREYIEVYPGETLNKIAAMYDVSVKKLMRYNELDRPEDLKANQYLFFAKKKNRGAKKYYTVQKGESMYMIAQKTGIKLRQLYRRNRVKEGYVPNAGETLYLRGRKPRS
ncbi:LysM peptidoglycan-binding domain-containing protein [Flavobacteriaceae bacterium Ap0902]|nr:LysM peptidoglycan-binding domain-containing protein [Flavobacteriaceae bacterium Ap0902]